MNQNQPIVCDLTVFPLSVRQQMAATLPEIFQGVQTVQELSDGFAFRFPNQPGRFLTLAHFIENERQCCPFYRFVLEIEPNGGPIWLRLTGGEDVKQFLETVWNNLQGAVSKQLMQTGPGNDLDEAIALSSPVLAGMMKQAGSDAEGAT